MRITVLSTVVALSVCLSANAENTAGEIADVHAAGHWSGCVFQEGFAPYPIRISPRPAPTLKVEYPGLCAGYHTPRQKGWPNDVVEVITKDIGTCIKSVDLEYSFQQGLLRIDYLIEGGAYALLLPVQPDAKPFECEPSESHS